jgi:hypothetical protein
MPTEKTTPDAMHIDVVDQQFEIGNNSLIASWTTVGGQFRPLSFTDKLSATTAPMGDEVFSIALESKKTLRASKLKIVAGPTVEKVAGDPKSSSRAGQLPGRQVSVTLEDPESGLHIIWRAIGRDGTRYLRQQVVLTAGKSDINIRRIVMLDLPLRFAWVDGTVKGAPIVASTIFCGLEHPMSDSEIDNGRAHCSLERLVPLAAGQSFKCSAVIGVTQKGQLRRDFNSYLECERAHPYRPFLHYNSWYDLGYFTRFDEASALSVIDTFDRELVKKRGVVMDSFLFDDGWDDPKTLWGFHAGFPNGFAAVKEAAEKAGAEPGVWMSPWGGYGKPHEQRLEYAKSQGFEINGDGFVLSGPKYYQRFHDVCLEMIRKYGINQFKFDGTGDAKGRWPGSAFGSDFEAAIQLIQDLRAEKPGLFVNLTTGTWPSPFWLQYADSIWRGGEDHSFAGVGSYRQQWITYRDGDTYREIVSASPLYPINSLMLHGLIYAKHAHHLDSDPQGDFASEVHTYFGTGTQLQEMYITPTLLSDKDWDTLAEAAKWARRNAHTLCDSHWIGGDPNKGEVYGWASWSTEKGILVLRNPSDQPAAIDIDIATAFELPVGAPRTFNASSPWKEEGRSQMLNLQGGMPHHFALKPFEVVTLDATPAKH